MLGKLIPVVALMLLGGDRSYTAGRFALTVDGQHVGFVKSVGGGPIKGEVSTHNLGPENVQKKHLATIKHEDITIEVGMGMSAPFYEWIRQSFERKHQSRDGVLVTAKGFDIAVSQAVVTEVKFPTLDAGNKGKPLALQVTFKGQAKLTQRQNKVAPPPKPKKPPPSVASFKFQIDGLKCRVTKVDGFSIKQQVAERKVKPAEFKLTVDPACASKAASSAKPLKGSLVIEQGANIEPIGIEFPNMKVTSMQSATSAVGEQTTVTVTVTAKAGFKANRKYPK